METFKVHKMAKCIMRVSLLVALLCHQEQNARSGAGANVKAVAMGRDGCDSGGPVARMSLVPGLPPSSREVLISVRWDIAQDGAGRSRVLVREMMKR